MFYKSALCCCLSTAAALTLSFAALDAQAGSNRSHRQIPSWYFGVSAAVPYVSDSDFTTTDTPSPVSDTFEYDQGYGLSGAIGYRPRYTNSFWDNTRFEFEIGFFDNPIDNLNELGINQEGVEDDTQVSRYMANAYADFDLTPQLRPYLGMGLGLARMHDGPDHASSFAYQGMTGIYYTPASFPVIELGIGYRYFSATDFEFVDPGSSSQDVEIDYDAHSIEAGLRAYF